MTAIPEHEVRTESGRYVRWAYLVQHLRREPHRSHLVFRDQTTRLVTTVHQKRHPDLHFSDGHLRAFALNVYRDKSGRERGDIYLVFIPDEG